MSSQGHRPTGSANSPTSPPDNPPNMGTAASGGPAFPYSVHMEGYDRVTASGMSLRAWFVGQALAGMPHTETDGFNWIHPDDMASRALKIADAALAEIQRTDGSAEP